MLLSKKIAKLRHSPTSQHTEDDQPSRIVKDTKKSLRCRFTEIPPPAKYVYSSTVYSIFGDIPCTFYKGEIATEISLYNETKNFKDIAVNKVNEQTIVTLKPTLKTDKYVPDWTELTNILSQTEDEKMNEWAKNIKSFCHTYSKVMQRQSRKKMKSGPRKQFFYHVTDETNSQSTRLFENFPCIKLRYRIKNHQNQLKEILLNERFVKEMGYSIDNFVTTVLQEGFPQLLPYENPLGPVVLKALIKNYFTIGDNGYQVDELACPLLMRNNLAKNMKFKSYFLMNYEDSVFGMDIIFAITAADEPYVMPKVKLNQELNNEFINLMSSQEGEIDYFVSNFYDQSIKRNYTNFHKTCMLKEIKYTSPNNDESKAEDEEKPLISVKYE